MREADEERRRTGEQEREDDECGKRMGTHSCLSREKEECGCAFEMEEEEEEDEEE